MYGSQNGQRKDTISLNEIGLRAGKRIWSIDKKENLHFDNEWNIHISSEICEENDYGHNLDLLNNAH